MGFPRHEYWSGLPFPPPVELPDRGIKLHLLCLLHWQAGWQAGSLPLSPLGSPDWWTSDYFPPIGAKPVMWLTLANKTWRKYWQAGSEPGPPGPFNFCSFDNQMSSGYRAGGWEGSWPNYPHRPNCQPGHCQTGRRPFCTSAQAILPNLLTADTGVSLAKISWDQSCSQESRAKKKTGCSSKFWDVWNGWWVQNGSPGALRTENSVPPALPWREVKLPLIGICSVALLRPLLVSSTTV